MTTIEALVATLLAQSTAELQLHSRYVSEGVEDQTADAAAIFALHTQTTHWSTSVEALVTPASDSDEVSLGLSRFQQWDQWLLSGGISVIQATSLGESDREAQLQIDWILREDLDLSLATTYGHRNDGVMVQAGIHHALPAKAGWTLDLSALQAWDGGYVTPGTRALNNLELAAIAMRRTGAVTWQLGVHHSFAQSGLQRIGVSDVSWLMAGLLWE